MNKKYKFGKIKNLLEFVDDEGALVGGETPEDNDSEVSADITTDDFMSKTRQQRRSLASPGGASYALSYGMIAEEDGNYDSSILNSANELISTLNKSNLNNDNIMELLKLIFKKTKRSG